MSTIGPVADEATTQKLSESQLAARLEVLSRINPTVYQQSSKVKALVQTTAEALQNDPRLVDLVSRFNLSNQAPNLLDIVQGPFDQDVKDRALNFLVANEKENTYLARLAQIPGTRVQLARNGSSRAVGSLFPKLLEEKPLSDESSKLIQILCSKKKAAASLLQKLVETPQIQRKEMIQVAIRAINQTPWDELKRGYRALIPSDSEPTNRNDLDIARLLAKEGDIENGLQVFRSPEFTCINCHAADGVGTDFGPGLSEIGKKLGTDAIFDAILNPSAGISFDYEGWNVILNSGDEFTGIVLSRTETHWTVKNLLGQIQEIPIGDIFEKQKMSTSLMPAGLGTLLGPEKLVDLVAYLSTLGK